MTGSRSKQAPPNDYQALPESLTSVTGFMLYWVTNIAGEFYSRIAASMGLESQHIAILQLLREEGPLVQSRLAERLHIHKTTMVHLLNGLAERGCIERRPYPSDKRALDVHLTDTGRALALEAEKRNQEADHVFFAALNDQEQATLRDLLARVATSHIDIRRLS